jgi:hypothetical protein
MASLCGSGFMRPSSAASKALWSFYIGGLKYQTTFTDI